MIIQYKIKSENKTKKIWVQCSNELNIWNIKAWWAHTKKKKKREKETVHKWISSDFN